MAGTSSKPGRAAPRLAAVSFLGLLAVAAAVFLAFSARYERQILRDMRLIALSLPVDLERLSGRPEDAELRTYGRIRSILASVLGIDARYKYAYVFALRGGQEIALVCTPAAPGTPEIAPGTVLGLTEPKEDLFFAGELDSLVFKPYRDPWGYWVSAAVPALVDPQTGEVLAAFGIDVSYSEWIAKVALETLLVILAMATLHGLVLLVVDRSRRLKASLEKLAAEERRKKESAEASEKAERDFLALMSHEIRNPLSAVVGFSRLLSETKLDGEQRDHVEMLRASSDHLMDLVNDILDFSKIEAGRMEIGSEPFDPMRLAGEVISIFSFQALRKGLDLALATDSPPCPRFLLGDEVRVRQIVVNLVSNAVKFTQRGSVTLRLSYAAGVEPSLVVGVEDTGPGMDAETMARLFMPFRQGEAGTRTGGTGLGLVISKRLVELMGGSLAVGSDLGGGSVFTVRLPLPACEEPAAELEELESPLAGLRVLAADDDAANRALVSSLLSRRGAIVSPAADGKEALASLLAVISKGGIDAAILDRSMPGMDGPSVARKLREAEREAGLPRLRLVALTASVSDEGARECLEAGFDIVLPKPFDPDRLAAAVLPEWLRGAHGQARPPASCGDREAPAPAAPRSPRGEAGSPADEAAKLVDEPALLKRAEGDGELAGVLRDAFAETMVASVAAAEAALASDELAAARAAAHKLRGSALNACAEGVARVAAELEAAAAGGDAARARKILDALAALIGIGRRK